MATAKEINPKVVTIYGRLSFPTFTAQAAYERSLKGDYPSKTVQDAKPDFQLLLEQPQLDKLRTFITGTFLPYCISNGSKDVLDAKEVKMLTDQFMSDDLDGSLNTPLKPVHEKTALLAPEAVGTLKCIGNAGVDITLMAIVQDENELAVPDPDILKFPIIRPVNQTVHDLYPGSYVVATLNLYAYHNGKHPGFSAGASTAVFKADAERFGGGVSVDEEEMFMD